MPGPTELLLSSVPEPIGSCRGSKTPAVCGSWPVASVMLSGYISGKIIQRDAKMEKWNDEILLCSERGTMECV